MDGEERKAKARIGLAEAASSQDINALRSALDEAEAAGLNAEEVGAARKAQARIRLAEAANTEDIDDLRSALDEAAAAGVPVEELGAARLGLSEIEVLEHFAGAYARMGSSRYKLEPGLDGMTAFFVPPAQFHAYGLVLEQAKNDAVFFSGQQALPFKVLDRVLGRELLLRCDIPSGQIDNFPGPEILILQDNERVYGANFVWAHTQESMAREMGRITARRKKIIAQVRNRIEED